MLGLWIDIANELPTYLVTTTRVMKADGTIVTYNGSNASDMVGFYLPTNANARDAFGDFNYLAPVGKAQIEQYADAGYTLTQTAGWF